MEKLDPETLKGLVMLTAILTLGLPILLVVLTQKANQYVIGFGAAMGIVIGNLLAMSSPVGVLFWILEAVIAIILVGGVILASAERHHTVIGVGDSHERGLPALMYPDSPMVRHEQVRGAADYARLEDASRVIDATNRLEQARHERALLKAQVRQAQYLGSGDPEQAYREQLLLEQSKARTQRRG